MPSSVALMSGVLALAPAIATAWGWPPGSGPSSTGPSSTGPSSPVPAAAAGPQTSIFGASALPTDAASQPPGLTGAGGGSGRASQDKEIIRRIIRRHVAEVKGCYEPFLDRQPTLAGRIGVTFTIDANGKVVSSVLERSTMKAPAVERCIVDAVRTWEFPKPKGGGVVIVTYPFVLTPAEDPPLPRAAPPSP